MSDWLEGRVDRVRWRSADGAFAVLTVTSAQGPLTVVGPLGLVADLEEDHPFVAFEGSFERHRDHGHQFKATSAVVGSPRTREGVALYLAGVPGIGPGMAWRIVKHFGDDTLTLLESDPSRLQEIGGIGPARAEALAAAWAADAGTRGLTILLRGLGVSARLVQRIRERFGDEAYDVVTRRPYHLAETIRGIGFLLADRLARTQGLPPDDPARVQAAVLHVLRRTTDDGHCYVGLDDLERGLSRLDVPTAGLADAVDAVRGRGTLIELGGTPRRFTTPELDEAEAAVAGHLRTRAVQAHPVADDAIDDAERFAGVTLDPSQRAAVAQALGHGVAVITGGPGTGKTTLVRVLLRVVVERGETWALASPTGRAARRLAEATGQEAATVHRLLGYQPGAGGFQHHEAEPLEVDGVLVDEASMVDVVLMAALVRALPPDARLVLVGDADQLPSVGPGQVLRDLVDSGRLPVARLDTVHRQDARSGILVAARETHAGRAFVSGERAGYDDVFLVERDAPEDVVATLLEVVTRRLPAKGHHPLDDVQVLTPTRKGPLGTAALNEALQAALNPDGPELKALGRTWRRGDKVMCTKNRYDVSVFNGDVGRIEAVDAAGLTIRFDDAEVPWPREQLDLLDHGYAVTVHKSQGSEYPAVVLLLHAAHGILLRRNLVYTALTRAKAFLCLVGQRSALERALRRSGDDRRRTTLGERLAGARLGTPGLFDPWGPDGVDEVDLEVGLDDAADLADDGEPWG